MAQTNYASAAFGLLAGTRFTSGATDGLTNQARFFHPYAIARDVGGNLYVADLDNHTIRKISTNGSVSKLAGLAGMPGNTNGSGSDARFNYPSGLTVDVAGNIFIADWGNHQVRLITPAGVVSTYAGSSAGSSDGTLISAKFSGPRALVFDSNSNLVVADQGNHTIRKITPSGTVSTLAGMAAMPGTNNGTGSAARFNSPSRVTADAAGNVFVTDTGNQSIRKVTSTGLVTTIAGVTEDLDHNSLNDGGFADGPGGTARFREPQGITLDGFGNIYLADTYNSVIRRISSTGQVTTLGGWPEALDSVDGEGSDARFVLPADLVLDGNGNLIIADWGDNTLRKGSPLLTLNISTAPPNAVNIDVGMSLPAYASFTLLRASQPNGPWVTNTTATLTENQPGAIYRFTETGVGGGFFRVHIP